MRIKTREAALWRWLRGARKLGYWVERVENMLAKSMPDVEASTGAGGFWVELKTAAKPVREVTPVSVTFQRGQAKWLRRRWYVDRCAWLLLQVGTARYMIPGREAVTIEKGVTELELAAHAVAPSDATPAQMLEAVSNYIWCGGMDDTN